MPSRERKGKEFKTIVETGNQRKLSFKKKGDEVRRQSDPHFY